MTSNIEYLECLNFENKQTPKELLDNLVNFFKSTPVLDQEFSKVTVVHNNELAAVVPNHYLMKVI